ncbi:MAG TPA: homocysteine S-methyltransferase family protein, partial [Gaiellaceae bacterium]|nr:homocysteine S-methyltransferase family protein [Gaiellaceae bacterium]
MTDIRGQLETLLAERILVLDGAWGVLIHRRGFSEEEYRGERFASHTHDVKGDPDLLNLTAPHVVAEIHDAYFEAGADIATTNTFTATSIGQSDYSLQDVAAEMSLAGARLAREAADRWTERTPERPRFVAGSVGPLNVTLSLSPKVEDPAYRAVTFAQVQAAYEEQIRALRD